MGVWEGNPFILGYLFTRPLVCGLSECLCECSQGISWFAEVISDQVIIIHLASINSELSLAAFLYFLLLHLDLLFLLFCEANIDRLYNKGFPAALVVVALAAISIILKLTSAHNSSSSLVSNKFKLLVSQTDSQTTTPLQTRPTPHSHRPTQQNTHTHTHTPTSDSLVLS